MDSDSHAAEHHAVVIGANGGIGNALVDVLSTASDPWHIYAAGRTRPARLPERATFVDLNITEEASIERAAAACEAPNGLDLVIVATGMLHDGPQRMPEKSWRDIDPQMFAQAFAINCTAPALLAKHFLPLLTRKRKSVFAALSARVGSIGDNRLGGWHAYRASKAALNMVIRTLSIELQRNNPTALCIGLHPGTVATSLSEPFQARVPARQLFSPQRAASQLLEVISGADVDDSGCVLAWDGQTIPP